MMVNRESITANTYLAALTMWRRLVVGLPLVFAAAVATTLLVVPRTYIARAAFLASEQTSLSSSLGALSSVASQLGVPGLSAIASGAASGSPQFYAELLTSATLLHTIVTTRFEATDTAAYGGAPFAGTLVEYLKPTGPTEVDRELAAIKQFTTNVLTVSSDRTTGIVKFEVKTMNRQLSALVARRMLDLVNEFNLRRRQTQAGAERDFSAVRSATALDTLRAAEAALAEFRTANIDFSHSPVLAAREGQLQRRVSLAQQIYNSVTQRYELATIEAVRNTPVVTVLDGPEGLVLARPRHIAAWSLAAAIAGLATAALVAFWSERPRAAA